MRSRSATEVPPNFITMRDKGLASGGVGTAKAALLATRFRPNKVDAAMPMN
jgi:hypothetical protein